MPGRTLPTITVTIEKSHYRALKELRKEEGISASFAVRKGLEMWLESKGIKTGRGRPRSPK